GKEIAEPLPESDGQLVETQQGDIALAPFDAADVRAVELGFIGKIFLRPAARLAGFANAPPERCQYRLLLPGIGHTGQLTGEMTMRLRTMSSILPRLLLAFAREIRLTGRTGTFASRRGCPTEPGRGPWRAAETTGSKPLIPIAWHRSAGTSSGLSAHRRWPRISRMTPSCGSTPPPTSTKSVPREATCSAPRAISR